MSEHHTDEGVAVLRGGSRDGESTTVAHSVTRLLAASDAPGLVDVYARTEETVEVRGVTDDGVVFEYFGQEVAGDLAPEMMHLPG